MDDQFGAIYIIAGCMKAVSNDIDLSVYPPKFGQVYTCRQLLYLLIINKNP